MESYYILYGSNVFLIHLFDLVKIACVQTIIVQNSLKPLRIWECWKSILLLQTNL